VQAVGMTRINIGIMTMGRVANMESAWKKNCRIKIKMVYFRGNYAEV
jgi:hypothetical protein